MLSYKFVNKSLIFVHVFFVYKKPDYKKLGVETSKIIKKLFSFKKLISLLIILLLRLITESAIMTEGSNFLIYGNIHNWVLIFSFGNVSRIRRALINRFLNEYKILKNICTISFSQPEHDVKKTSFGRCYDI